MIVPFERVDAPRHHSAHPIRHVAAWYTWTERARLVLLQWRRSGRDPSLVHLREGRPYDYTFSLAGIEVDAQLLAATRELAEGFLALRKTEEIRLVHDLLRAPGDGDALHRMLACLRDCMATILADDFGSLYTPLGRTGMSVGGFPLHADLYQADMLLNVFDIVPDGDEGASVFLSAAELDKVMSELTSMPADVRSHAQRCLSTPVLSDRYGEFYSLLHDPVNAWSEDLKIEFERRQIQIKFRRGEGYLIHDRSWLHGRTAPQGGVDERRLYRLIFSSAA